MIKVKKICIALTAAIFTAVSLGGCHPAVKEGSTSPESLAGSVTEDSTEGSNGETAAAAEKPEDKPADKALQVVCTIFPQYDFVRQILGDNPAEVEVSYLLGSGVDLHNYQASADDMIKIRTSDLFLYVGGESDQWADAVIEQAGEQFHALALVDMVEVKEELLVEGMQPETDQEADAKGEEDVHDDEPECDEHVWLSLKNAVLIVDQICDELCAADSANRDYYKANAKAYTARLKELDSRYERAVEESARQTILIADRFPFRYLADDYGLSYYAAFPGCSAETEASFQTIVFLAQKTGELKLPVVFVIDGSSSKIAQTVIENSKETDVSIRILNSIQSVSQNDIDSGVSYLAMMEENLIKLKEALN